MAEGKNIKAHYPRYVVLQPRASEDNEWDRSLQRELRKLGFRCVRYTR
jgi:hypothetical protein